ncbi:colicin-like pore-forming protein [Pseudomonas abietaniphila]|uniref:colicin-like pore-forming protein n=1 Tax=Pseudomonas abietaniphila TaxID=89065 RepID=UPI0032171369
MMAKFLNERTANLEELAKLYKLFDDAYSAALEIKLLTLSEKTLSGMLPGIAAQKDNAEYEAGTSATFAAQDLRMSVIERERDIYVQQLPKFLQSEFATEAGHMEDLPTSQALRHYQATLERMAANKLSEIQPIQAPPPYSRGGITIYFSPNNPQISAPLSKPELEALNELVYLQNNTKLGTKWLTYHEALLKTESAAHLKGTSEKFSDLGNRADDAEQMKDAIKFTMDFYAEAGEKFGDNASALAEKISQRARGKKIRNAEEALKAYDKYKHTLDTKFSVKDRDAIAKALESLDAETMAKSLTKLGKSLGAAGVAIDAYDLIDEARKSTTTGDWSPFFIKVETILLGKTASVLIAVMFGLTASTPIGILGFALIMAATSAMIDDELTTQINDFIMSL